METLQPKLRFPEFDGNWERKKISEVSKIGRGKSKHRPRDAEFLYGGIYPFIQTGDIRNADLYLTKYSQTYSEEGLKQSKIWDENTLCITIAANIAETTILKIKACFPDSIIGLIPNDDKTIVLFVKYQFDKFKIEIQSLSQGVAQANLNQEKLSNIEFHFPSLQEQAKIANFLSSVDEKLNLLKEKKETLEEYKKGIMQKIFNQEIRFKDDNGNDFEDWEEKSLGEILSIGNGKDYKHLNIGNIPVYGTGGLMTYVDKYLYQGETVCIGRKGTIDKPMYFNGSIWTVDTLFYTHSFINSYAKYIFYLFQSINWKQYNEASGVPSLSKKTIEQISFTIPSFQEQTKIANFLSAIDEKIELVNTQIEDTQEYKKGLLQQMFV
jgi:type I restriction enzyme, S subunit